MRSALTPLPTINYQAFADDVQALRSRLNATLGSADLVHLKKMEGWGRACSLLGYATAWLAPNPLSAAFIGLGNVARWTMVTHHVMHRGYDQVPGVPARYRSENYAQGWRRWLDWPDWIHPQAWAHEHNQLHHLHLGELEDPDLVEHNSWLIRATWLPRPLKWLLVTLLAATWKFSYYAPNTWWGWQQHRQDQANKVPRKSRVGMGRVWRLLFPGERVWLPVTTRALHFYLSCVLPYALLRFGLVPGLFLPLGTWAWAAVLINSLLAELLANAYAFAIIVPNHAGDDVYRFDGRVSSKTEFYLRQIVGSVNYPGGSDFRDFSMGYLNYQIEHHVWPDLPMLKYREAAPQLKAICQKHGVPYVEQALLQRVRKLLAIMLGDRDMLRSTTTLAECSAQLPAQQRESAQTLPESV